MAICENSTVLGLVNELQQDPNVFIGAISSQLMGPNTRLLQSLTEKFVDEVSTQVLRNESKKDKRTIRVKLEPAQQVLLQKLFPEFAFTFQCDVYHQHPFPAASRICELDVILRSFDINLDTPPPEGYDFWIIDIGGNPMTHFKANRTIHSCSPMLDQKDAIRSVERARVMDSLTSQNKIFSPKQVQQLMTGHCDKKAQDCDVTSPYGIMIHSCYNIKLVELADIMQRKKMSMIHGSFIWNNVMLIKDEGRIDSLKCYWKKNKTGKNVTIEYGFEDDGSLTYVHDFTTVAAYATVSTFFSSDSKNVYGIELSTKRDGIQFFKVYECVTVLPKQILRHNLFFEDYRNKVVISLLLKGPASCGAPGGLVKHTAVVDKALVEAARKFALSTTEEKFKAQEIYAYICHWSQTVFFNNRDVTQRSTTSDAKELYLVSQAVYFEVFKFKYAVGKGMQLQIEGTKKNRELQDAGKFKLLLKWLTGGVSKAKHPEGLKDGKYLGKPVCWEKLRKSLMCTDDIDSVVDCQIYTTVSNYVTDVVVSVESCEARSVDVNHKLDEFYQLRMVLHDMIRDNGLFRIMRDVVPKANAESTRPEMMIRSNTVNVDDRRQEVVGANRFLAFLARSLPPKLNEVARVNNIRQLPLVVTPPVSKKSSVVSSPVSLSKVAASVLGKSSSDGESSGIGSHSGSMISLKSLPAKFTKTGPEPPIRSASLQAYSVGSFDPNTPPTRPPRKKSSKSVSSVSVSSGVSSEVPSVTSEPGLVFTEMAGELTIEEYMDTFGFENKENDGCGRCGVYAFLASNVVDTTILEEYCDGDEIDMLNGKVWVSNFFLMRLCELSGCTYEEHSYQAGKWITTVAEIPNAPVIRVINPGAHWERLIKKNTDCVTRRKDFVTTTLVHVSNTFSLPNLVGDRCPPMKSCDNIIVVPNLATRCDCPYCFFGGALYLAPKLTKDQVLAIECDFSDVGEVYYIRTVLAKFTSVVMCIRMARIVYGRITFMCSGYDSKIAREWDIEKMYGHYNDHKQTCQNCLASLAGVEQYVAPDIIVDCHTEETFLAQTIVSSSTECDRSKDMIHLLFGQCSNMTKDCISLAAITQGTTITGLDFDFLNSISDTISAFRGVCIHYNTLSEDQDLENYLRNSGFDIHRFIVHDDSYITNRGLSELTPKFVGNDVCHKAIQEIRQMWVIEERNTVNNLQKEYNSFKAGRRVKDYHFGIYNASSKTFLHAPSSGKPTDYGYDIANQKFVVTADCMSGQLLMNKDTRVMNQLSLFSSTENYCFEKLSSIVVVGGPPGCGKTTQICEAVDLNVNHLVLTASKENRDDIRRRLGARYPKLVDDKIMTIHSYLINKRSHADVVFIDEALKQHLGEIALVATFSKAKKVLCFGDKNQIPYYSKVVAYKLRYATFDVSRFPTIFKNVSFRIPCDVGVFLNQLKIYNQEIKVTSRVLSSMKKHLIATVAQVDTPHLAESILLTFTQAEKEMVLKEFNGMAGRVFTCGEYQGNENAHIILIRLKPTVNRIYNDKHQWVVAVSRHTLTFDYFTVVADPLYDMIGNQMGRDCESVRIDPGAFALTLQDNVIAASVAILQEKPGMSLREFKEEYLFKCGTGIPYKEMNITEDQFLNRLGYRLIDGRFVPEKKGGEIIVSPSKSNRPMLYPKPVRDYMPQLGCPDVRPTTYRRVERGYVPSEPRRPLARYDNIESLQIMYDILQPGNGLRDSTYDQHLMEHSKQNFLVDDCSFSLGAFNSLYKVKPQLRPHLRTSCPRNQITTQKAVMKAFAERNGLVPELSISSDIDITSTVVADRFFATYIDEGIVDFSEPITPNSESLSGWLKTQPPAVAGDINRLKLFEVDPSRYTFALKRNPKPALDGTGEHKYISPQTIAFSDKAVNAFFCPIARDLKNRLMVALKKNFVINTDESLEDFEIRLNRYMPPRVLKNFYKCEIDMSKYDKSQDLLAMHIVMKIFIRLGYPLDYITEWWQTFTGSTFINFPTKFKAFVHYQQRSGGAFTFLANTVFLMAVLASIYDIEYGMFAGDDSNIYTRNFVQYDDILQMSDTFNLDCKRFSYQSVYFCSKFLVPISDLEWRLVPDPVKLLTKLGRHDIVDEQHLEEYRVSCLDVCRSFDDLAIVPGLDFCVADRYRKNINTYLLLGTILNYLDSTQNFKKLFYNPYPNLIFTGIRPSLDI